MYSSMAKGTSQAKAEKIKLVTLAIVEQAGS